MRICIIHNPRAGQATGFEPVQQALDARDDLTLVEPDTPAAMRAAISQAAQDGFDVVVAAGGDGTVHAVANALLATGDSAETRPILGVLPLGTGNDLARTLAIPFHAGEALALIGYGKRHALEAIRVDPMDGEACHAFNLANGGFTGQMRDALTDELKDRWGPLAYMMATAETMPAMNDYAVRLTFDDRETETHRLYNLVVAAGRTAGGGHPVAPTANPEDGLLEVVMVRSGTAGEVASLITRAITKVGVTESGLVTIRRARQLRVESDPPMRFAIDGEMKAETPVTFTVVPKALRVIVGDDYHADPS